MQVIYVPFEELEDWAKEHVLDGYLWGCECGESYTRQEYAENCKKCRKYLMKPATQVFFTQLPKRSELPAEALERLEDDTPPGSW